MTRFLKPPDAIFTAQYTHPEENVSRFVLATEKVVEV
jgi:hypothetical protein